jgi:hypothetical protein
VARAGPSPTLDEVVGDDEDDGNKSGRSKRDPDGKKRNWEEDRRKAITQSWRNPSGETGGHRNSGWGGIKAQRPHE